MRDGLLPAVAAGCCCPAKDVSGVSRDAASAGGDGGGGGAVKEERRDGGTPSNEESLVEKDEDDDPCSFLLFGRLLFRNPELKGSCR